MGWIAGAWRPTPQIRQKILSGRTSPGFLFDRDQLVIIGDGLAETFFHEISDQRDKGWAVSGIGITRSDSPKLMDQERWAQLLTCDNPHLNDLNGHFAAMTWGESGINFFTDAFGLKNFYFHSLGPAILFSTRLDKLLPLSESCSINWHAFGSRWVGTHGYGTDSFINGIDRLSQGGTAHIAIDEGNLQIQHQRWMPGGNHASPEKVNQLLSSFATLPQLSGKTVSLGLSGGFDSRVLLAHLINHPGNNWQTHTFGPASHPDRKLADKLAELTQKNHYPLPEPGWTTESIIQQLPSFVGQTLFTSLPHTMMQLSAYARLREMDVFVIDGAFGEIARRRLAQRIYLRRSRALQQGQFEKLLPLFEFYRADIFTNEIKQRLQNGFREELMQEFERMPDASVIGTENWIDLFSIRTQAPNAGGPEQSRSDSILPNYMAYLQPQFVDAVMSLPLKYRRNGTLLRQYLRQHNPDLCNVPLVKGVRSYPFWMKDKPAAVWTSLKYLFKTSYQDNSELRVMKTLEEYIRDTATSQEVRSYPAFNHDKIEKLIDLTFNESDLNAAHELNWWLTFEIFRKLVHKQD